MIKLDGSFGEGGGAILRHALALSTLTGKPFEIENIRKGRPKPGLKAQHVHSVVVLEKLSGCSVTGCEVGSEKLTFVPGEIKNKSVKVDVGTAGSITLLLQSVIIPCIFSGKTVSITIIGGTDVKWSVPIDYMTNVLVPYLRRVAEIEVQIAKRGYYPSGGGEVTIKIKGQNSMIVKETKIDNRGKLLSIRGISHASADLMEAKVADRQAESAKIILQDLNVSTNIIRTYNKTLSIGSGITLWALFENQSDEYTTPIIIGADALGERGKKAEDVGEEAARKLKAEMNSQAAVDKYLADQLISFIAVTKGKIATSEVTNHTKSNIYVAEKFLNTKFRIEENTIISE
ncbi:MAG: RNA 3'-terminal phosphate cyclase [Nanoarchaeota archaeon]|nr:RNA 3'-terminal phosphate cyclase [Nanoarchaeota archaeon]MBU1270476.1 RNA 3'-terminal phosphate cyclase [Nanoarchaeota archaeon]MBU1603689.1 RNA 3'-terminal phosphate cyclase [Nanoarchaeota archaeon]MBU2443716.1 RNA 3'-terminal phosphate cyclase [Nanoarchaeota archaeon]